MLIAGTLEETSGMCLAIAVFPKEFSLMARDPSGFIPDCWAAESVSILRLIASNRTGVLCILLCLALGIANIFRLDVVIIVFSVICLFVIHPLTRELADKFRITGLLLLFVEVPLLLRICPTSPKFDEFMRRFTTN